MSDKHPFKRVVWTGPKHPDHDGLLILMDRTGQVWEDSDGWIYFIVGEPKVACFDLDGRPFQYEHKVLVMNHEGELQHDWPLFETNDRPLETNTEIARLS